MTRVYSIFSQILQLIPRLEFESAARRHKAERHARGFTCWGQFVAMLFCPLGNAKSLREICGGLAASEGKLRHLGLPGAPPRSTLAYANQHRPWQVYQTVFHQLREKCQTLAARRPAPKRKFHFKNKLMSLDATVIDLCASVFDWAQFRRTKGAVKLHLLLDQQGHLPAFAVVTEGKKHEIQVAREIDFTPGTTLVIDRGYTDYQWFAKLTQRKVHFVTRLKENADYGVVERRALPPRRGVRRDEVIFFFKLAQAGVECFFRRIEFYDEAQDRVLVFLTNHLGWSPATVAALYKQRWQIELFQGAQTASEGEDLRGDFCPRLANPDLDGAHCHATDPVSAAPGYLRLVSVESGGLVAPAIVRLPRLVDLVECSLPATAGTRLRTPATAVGASLKRASNLDSSRKLITKKHRKEAEADSLT